MHPEAYQWVAQHATDEPVVVLDIGGRDINGTTRALFPNAEYVALDILPGTRIDIVADAATWKPDRAYDMVVSTEVFEHAEDWRDVVGTAYRALKPGGRLVATMAGPGRGVHSGVDGEWRLHDGEHYENIDPKDLGRVLDAAGFKDVVVDVLGLDVRCVASRPKTSRA